MSSWPNHISRRASGSSSGTRRGCREHNLVGLKGLPCAGTCPTGTSRDGFAAEASREV